MVDFRQRLKNAALGGLDAGGQSLVKSLEGTEKVIAGFRDAAEVSLLRVQKQIDPLLAQMKQGQLSEKEGFLLSALMELRSELEADYDAVMEGSGYDWRRK